MIYIRLCKSFVCLNVFVFYHPIVIHCFLKKTNLRILRGVRKYRRLAVYNLRSAGRLMEVLQHFMKSCVPDKYSIDLYPVKQCRDLFTELVRKLILMSLFCWMFQEQRKKELDVIKNRWNHSDKKTDEDSQPERAQPTVSMIICLSVCLFVLLVCLCVCFFVSLFLCFFVLTKTQEQLFQ